MLACVHDRGKRDDAHTHDVYFRELMAAPWTVIEAIYRKAELPLAPAIRANMEAFVARNPRGKHGQIVYDLRRDFGRTPDSIRQRFQFYFDRFPIRVEVD